MSNRLRYAYERFLLYIFMHYLLSSPSLVYAKQINKRTENLKFNSPSDIELLKRIKAADIKSCLDTAHDPCNNFYSYACGNWARSHTAEVLHDGATSKWHMLHHAWDKKVEKLMNTFRAGDEIEGKIRNFHQSCRHIKQDACAYYEALNNFYQQFGQFSFHKKNGHGKSTFNWWSTVARIQQMYGQEIIISIDVNYDIKNPNNTMIYIRQAQGSTLSHAQNAPIAEGLRKMFNVTYDEALLVANDVEVFQEALSKARIDYGKGDSSLHSRFSLYNLNDLHRKYKDLFDVQSLLKIALNIDEMPSEVYVEGEEYFHNLLHIFDRTPSETVENFILWSLIKDDYLIDAEATTATMDYVCLQNTKYFFSKYIQYAIYEKYRSWQYERQIYTMWHDLKAVIVDNLQEDKYQWMSNGTRNAAMEKLSNMQFYIKSYDEEDWRGFFQGLVIDSTSCVANVQNVLKHFQSMRGDKLHIKSESLHKIFEASLQPLYEFNKNRIAVNVAALQPYYEWHPAYPKAMLYAGLGTMVAHEILQAFMNQGRQYDANGYTINNWWDDSTTSEYEQQSHCFQSQYHSHGLADVPAQDGNVADNAAVQVAYFAYIRYIENEIIMGDSTDDDEMFTNMPYNNQQLFFITYAQSWCDDMSSQPPTEDVPGEVRVQVTLSNFLKFSEVFQCNADAVMNPSKRCEIF